MARHPETTESAIRSIIAYMKSTGHYSQETIRTYYWHMRTTMRLINTNFDENATPRTVTREQIVGLLDLLRQSGYMPTTQRIYLFALRTLCEYCGNRVFDSMRIAYQTDMRPNADWLSLHDAETVLDTQMDARERIIIWLGLCHGLRRVEIVRMRTGDIDGDCITVRGKGQGSAKLRVIRTHPQFKAVLKEWLAERKSLVSGAENHTDALIIYRKGKYVHEYTASGIAQIVIAVSRRADIPFSSHTLRRTFGREMYHCGVAIPTIQAIYGHKSIDQTIRYLGINLDDMASAMSRFNLGQR